MFSGDLNAAERWPEEKVRRLRTYIAEGLSDSEIARHMGVSRNVIIGKRSRLALKANSACSVWTPEKDQRLREYARQGLDREQAAQALGVCSGTIYRRARRLGIRFVDGRTQYQRHRRQERARHRRQERRIRVAAARENTEQWIRTRFAEGYMGQHGRLHLHDLRAGACRFPIDQEKGPVKYCGLAIMSHSRSWCPEHYARLYPEHYARLYRR